MGLCVLRDASVTIERVRGQRCAQLEDDTKTNGPRTHPNFPEQPAYLAAGSGFYPVIRTYGPAASPHVRQRIYPCCDWSDLDASSTV